MSIATAPILCAEICPLKNQPQYLLQGMTLAAPTIVSHTNTNLLCFGLRSAPYIVEFQQNLNHFWPAKPGHFDVAFSTNFVGNLTDKDFTIPFGEKLPDFDAHDMVTQTNFTIPVHIPDHWHPGGRRADDWLP